MASFDFDGTRLGTRQFLSFHLDDEEFALEVAKVREVLDRTGVTRVPRMPDFMRGVLNLRGIVLPVVDMRVRFGMGETVETVETCIIVVDVEIDGEPTLLGAMVDGVNEVFDLSDDEIEAPPKMGAKLATEFIAAMAKREDGFIIVLDADRVFTAEEIIALRGASARASGTSPDGEPAATAKKPRTARKAKGA